MDMNQLGSGPKLNISQTKLKHIVTEQSTSNLDISQLSYRQEDERLSRSLDQNEIRALNSELIEHSELRVPKQSILKGSRNQRAQTRLDRNGTVIDRKQKRYKISFADNVTNDKAKLADVYFVESYKRYNAENTHGT